MISFGRRVIPHNDRVAERKLIIERRKKIDALIFGGLRQAGVEIDAEERRIQTMMQSTGTSSLHMTNEVVNEQAFLPNLPQPGDSSR